MTMHNEVYWTMKDGTKIKVDDMDIVHLRNTLKMIIRNNQRVVVAPRPKFQLNGDIANMMIDSAIDNEIFEAQEFDEAWYQHGFHY